MIFDLLYRTLNLNFLLLFFAAKIRDTHTLLYITMMYSAELHMIDMG